MAHNVNFTPGSGGVLCAYDLAAGGAYPTTGEVPVGAIMVSANATTAPTPVTAANPFYVTLATTLDAANDSVRARAVSGVLDDGAGAALAVKTARGSSSSSGVNAAVAAVTSKKIRVLAYSLQAADANGATVAANWQDDSGSPVLLSQSWDLAAREGVSKPLSAGPGFYFQTTSGQALVLNLGAAQAVRWELCYVEA